MWLKLTNDKCILHGPRTPEEVAWLRGFLTFGDPQSDKDPHAKPQISLYNVFDNSFPAGLLALVKRELKASGLPYKIEVADTRERPCERVPLAEVTEHLAAYGCTLRPHQVEATEAAMKTSRGIVQLPTGTGKTTRQRADWARSLLVWSVANHRSAARSAGYLGSVILSPVHASAHCTRGNHSCVVSQLYYRAPSLRYGARLWVRVTPDP